MDSRFRKRKHRGSAKLLAVVLLGLVGLGGYGKLHVDSVEEGAHALATTGQEAQRLFKDFTDGLKASDAELLRACYLDDAEAAGRLRRNFVSERDGIRLYGWSSEGGPVSGADLETEHRALVSDLGRLELSKLKLARVEEQSDAGAVVRAVLWLRGERSLVTEEGGEPTPEAYETQMHWRFHLENQGSGYRIARQELLSGTTVEGERRGFTNVAEAAGIDFRARRNPKFATEEWFPERFEIIQYGSAGVSAADYDGDGYEDLYFADGAAPRLYRNRGDGTFEDVTATVGLPLERGGTNVALFADFDNDGDPDLLLSGFTSPSQLFRNDGPEATVRFTDVTEAAGLGEKGFVTVAAASDVDGDGLLDLYLGRYLDPRINLPTTLFYTRNSEGNSLLRNLGGLSFEDITESAGVWDGGLTLGVGFADYDQDGDQDLYVANDFGRNTLFANRGDGTFDDVSEATGTLDFGYGMSAEWGDVDNDLDLDLYVSNVHSGQRWYGQAATLYQYLLTSLRQGTIREDMGLYREIYGFAGDDWRDYGDRMVKGNSLMLNGGETFEEIGEAANANPFGWYWGSTFLDFDHDGRLDIYAANGWITAESQDDL